MRSDQQIIFRLDEDDLDRLVERRSASNDKKKSLNLFARSLIQKALQNDAAPDASEGVPFLERFDQLEHDLIDLKKDLCLAVEALLIATSNRSKQLSPEQAKTWVKTHLRSAKVRDQPADGAVSPGPSL